MPDQLAFLPERVLTLAAMPGAGYRVQFYQSGTTTPVTVYTSPSLATPHPSPLTCDAGGVFPAVFSPGGAVKAVITKPDGSTYYTLDPVFRVPTSASGAAEITFSPTVALPFENVQAAIEGAAATAASGFTPFGLGVTGTNALVANLDATNIASGAYRFDNTTTGTFPTGVVAADTGTIQLWRENSGDAVMRLQSGAADREFVRRLASSVWGAWREVITVNQGAAQGDIIYRDAAAWVRLAKGGALQNLRMNAGATAPEWAGGGPSILASGSFNGFPSNGTYSRTGTLVTVTLTAHGMSTGHSASLDFTSGTATDGYYTVTVVDANTFTVTDTASGTTSGNVTRLIHTRNSFNVANITRASAGNYNVNFTTAMPNANYGMVGSSASVVNRASTALSMNRTSPPVTTGMSLVAGPTGGDGLPSTPEDSYHINFLVFG